MAIKQVRANIDGNWYTLELDSSTGKYTATITAPSITSFNEDGGYYNVSVEATNDAGTVGTSDAGKLEGLKFYVKENVAPVITILSPATGARTTNNKQPVIFTVVDEVNGSGINIASLIVKLNGSKVSSSELAISAITNGYSVTYTPSNALPNGTNTVSVNVDDNDGNAAEEKTTSFVVDTVAPSLNITSPVSGLITSLTSLTIKGSTNDTTSSPVIVSATVNGVDVGAIVVANNGSFEKVVSLSSEGENIIVVTATDATGLSSTVSVFVILNTKIPRVVSASIIPNPADAGETVVISVEVAE